MINIETLINKNVGERIDFSRIDTGLNQKQLSSLLQEHGWQKDYHYPGEWVRVCRWKYLGYYEARRHGIPYARMRFMENIGDVEEVKESDVHLYCGMPMSTEMAAATMKQLGWELDKNIWRLKNE